MNPVSILTNSGSVMPPANQPLANESTSLLSQLATSSQLSSLLNQPYGSRAMSISDYLHSQRNVSKQQINSTTSQNNSTHTNSEHHPVDLSQNGTSLHLSVKPAPTQAQLMVSFFYKCIFIKNFRMPKRSWVPLVSICHAATVWKWMKDLDSFWRFSILGVSSHPILIRTTGSSTTVVNCVFIHSTCLIFLLVVSSLYNLFAQLFFGNLFFAWLKYGYFYKGTSITLMVLFRFHLNLSVFFNCL